MNYVIPFLFLVQGDYVENEPPKQQIQEEKTVDESCERVYDPRDYSSEMFLAPYAQRLLERTKPVCLDDEDKED